MEISSSETSTAQKTFASLVIKTTSHSLDHLMHWRNPQEESGSGLGNSSLVMSSSFQKTSFKGGSCRRQRGVIFMATEFGAQWRTGPLHIALLPLFTAVSHHSAIPWHLLSLTMENCCSHCPLQPQAPCSASGNSQGGGCCARHGNPHFYCPWGKASHSEAAQLLDNRGPIFPSHLLDHDPPKGKFIAVYITCFLITCWCNNLPSNYKCALYSHVLAKCMLIQ